MRVRPLWYTGLLFPHLPADSVGPLAYRKVRAHQRVDAARVRTVLYDQSLKQAPVPDRLNFSVLQLL